ncbi:M56 family metallopeptidase [Paenibacillus riograndensis]|uniref:Antirepressor regulating drug resistance protein n=1 Tax=Paenibacillus riograndensis SBR5 TaxID=1073571 RepID=A0A0E4CUR8_9BACL|nr:M56 family metallopeptidase [Paenibacillus riograndensis]CQR52705.1 antirepressor regulating drug resistance protein [Paenibacillus riograndensis SBR5]
MTAWFIAILNMSITASYAAIAVIIVRLLFRKAPKVFAYTLWVAVLVRLVLPFSFSSGFSFLSFLAPSVPAGSGAMEYIPTQIGLMNNPAVNIGTDVINQAVKASLPSATPAASVNPMQFIMELAAMVWLVGIVLLLSYSVIAYLKIIHKLRTATLVEGNVFESDRITTPFVYGFIRPRIVIPVGIKENGLTYILEHERTHIRRRDYLIKPLAFLVLVIHWFNPLMWISFTLMSKDMEMSCDESVLRKLGNGAKAGYSHSLLAFSVKRGPMLSGSPLAFGQSSIHARIKHVLNYKQPKVGAVAAASIVSLIFMVGLMANPAGKAEGSADQINKLATVWADALVSRDGHPRYAMMSAAMKEQFKQEQIARSGENWNYNIGVSSPWVADYEIRIEGKTARITYLTQTSEPAFYQSEESLTFAVEDGELVVAEYHSVVQSL